MVTVFHTTTTTTTTTCFHRRDVSAMSRRCSQGRPVQALSAAEEQTLEAKLSEPHDQTEPLRHEMMGVKLRIPHKPPTKAVLGMA